MQMNKLWANVGNSTVGCARNMIEVSELNECETGRQNYWRKLNVVRTMGGICWRLD